MAKRLSLNPDDAEHAYEWLRMYWHAARGMPGIRTCHQCAALNKRLERFIGPAAARRIRRLVRKNP